MSFTNVHPMIRVECSCSAAPLLGALDYGQDRWWWWPVIEDRMSVLATLKRKSVFAVVSSGEVPTADAVALGFLPGVKPDHSVTVEEALRHQTGLFGKLTTKHWLRSCPACGRNPEVKRRDLYALADAALADGVRTITVPA